MNTTAERGSQLADRPSSRGQFLRRTLAVFGLGLVGIVGLVVSTLLVPESIPVVAELPRSVLLVAIVVQPALLVLLAAAVGARLAPRVGFDSHAVARVDGTRLPTSLRDEARVALPAGLAAGVLVVVTDLALSAVVGVDSRLVPTEAVSLGAVLASLPLRFLYGGITEEVLLRWGFMTLLVWAGWRLAGRPATPSARTVWVALVVAAVAFGVGHLPAVAATTALTPALVAQVVLLNSVGGVVFGWVYWRYSLEAAMLAHGAAHVALVAPVVLAAL
ncbi:type II CAAX prenyl endopeptidase Rce1 family protein [Halomarina rubra]|uniref:Type II CAAX prenyl endopeptidase Rce1 family protein n=1 Tax=Halomarina rubra TaxID=2071873 RepID=A0ABD6AUY5_9EURY|nr:CPBP family glutamic-type intramembrane protease [Halomarina rubra]